MMDFHWKAQLLIGGLDACILGHYFAIQLLAFARIALALVDYSAFINSVSCVFSGPGHPPPAPKRVRVRLYLGRSLRRPINV